MNTANRLPIALLVLFSLLACARSEAGDGLAPDRTDREGLIEFAVPAGWNNNDSSSGRHFQRDDSAENEAMIYIEALERPASLQVDFIWEQTKGKHEVQGQMLKKESSSSLNGFELREAVYEANVRGKLVVYHDIFLFRDNLQVAMSLNASAEAYKNYVEDFRAAVGSVHTKGTE